MGERRTSRALLVAAVLLATPFAGCGDDEPMGGIVGAVSDASAGSGGGLGAGGSAGSAATGGIEPAGGRGGVPSGGRGGVASGGQSGAPSGGANAGGNGGVAIDGGTDAAADAEADAGDATPDAPDDAGDGSMDSPPLGLTDVGTLVIVGDSISSLKASWGYPALLRADLDARYGPVDFHQVAVAGSESNALAGQIASLPASMTGPVVVALTIGGNDVKNRSSEILGGQFETIMAEIASNIEGALQTLTQPDRYGAGVDVHVLQTNVYDPTDGQGNFGDFGCGFGGGTQGLPLDVFFWILNTELEAVILANGQSVLDLWDLFRFRGLNYDPTWFRDCQHPNEAGNDALRRQFYFLITGEML